MMLGDLGADVIKVERPGRGDDTRGWGPPFDARGESAYYLSTNRNKLSVVADLGSSRDRHLLRRLMTEADVVVDNFMPGVLDRAELSPVHLLEESPRLVWCTITGFGAASRRLGYDYVVQAESGWMAVTGEPTGAPMKTGVALADILAGKDAAIAILSALLARDGAPASRRHLVISLAHSARAALMNVAQNALVTGTEARRWGNAHANLVPYELFEARGRPIVIAVGTDDQWAALVRVLGLEDLERDAKLATNAGRLAQRERVVAAVARGVERRDAAELQASLDAAGVPCGIVKTVLEAIADAGGASAASGMPPSTGGTIRLPPPRLDEHGALVRGEGWDAFRRYR